MSSTLYYTIPCDGVLVGEVLEDVMVASASKSIGVFCIHELPREEDDDGDEDDREDDTKMEEAVGGDDRPAAAASKKLKKKKSPDYEHLLPVFISKSSLAMSNDAEKDGSHEVITPERIAKEYKVGSTIHRARVKGYSLVDGVVIATNLKDYVEGEVVHSSDLHVGQLLQVVVTYIKDFGLVVRISGGEVTAVCPTFHSADVVLEGSTAKLKKKFRVGQELAVRVWEVTATGIIVTHWYHRDQCSNHGSRCKYGECNGT
jgi:hypothetical protein